MPLYPEYIIREVADKNDIYDVVSQYVTLKKAGSSYVGLCPFHNEKTPSFSVSPQKGIFHCFGCSEGGNVIHFLMKIENISFVEAVEKLAQRAGISLPRPNEKDSAAYAAKIKQKEVIYEINKMAAQFFYDNLKSGKAAVEYFKKRSLDGLAAKRFFLGYARDSWNALFAYLKEKGCRESDILSAGLIKASDNGKYYDTFRNRVMFPIFDIRNRVIGFGGRVLDDSKPKYLNSSDSPVFNKSRNLYFLNVARRAGKDYVILVEGYMDVIALAKSGYLNTVATLGTALTAQQAKMIAGDFKEAVICYDSDEAGRKATARAITILREFDIKISAMNLRDKKDPDEYINAYGKTRFNNCIEKRKSDMAYLMEHFELKYDVQKNEEKVAYISEVLEYFKLIRNPVELDVYIEALSEKTGVAQNAIYSQLGVVKAVRSKPDTQEQSDIMTISNRNAKAGSDNYLNRTRQLLLGLLLSEKSLYKNHRAAVSETLFENETHLKLLRYIEEKYAEDSTIDLPSVIEAFENEEDIREITLILSLDNQTEDSEKAFRDYIKIINDRMNRNNILKMLGGHNSESIAKLNDEIKNQ